MENKKVFLIHGFEGSPNGGWRPWLMSELEKFDIYTSAIPMPEPEAPVLSMWINEIDHHIKNNLMDDIYLVGHSLGGTAILRYLEKIDIKNIKGIILVSSPCNKNANKKISSFLEDPFNWESINNKSFKKIVIHGDNDPYVPISDAHEISEKINGTLIIIPNGKHLNGSAGFITLPEALTALLEIIK